jgi:hypothetical protein
MKVILYIKEKLQSCKKKKQKNLKKITHTVTTPTQPYGQFTLFSFSLSVLMSKVCDSFV